MKTRPQAVAGTLLLIGLLSISIAAADEQRGWYVGVGAGSSDDDVLDESDTGIKLFGGYRFNKIIAVEGAFVDLGEFFFDEIEQYGFAVEGEATLPVGKIFGLFAKAGWFNWTVDVAGFGSDDGTDLTYGVGAKVGLGKKWAIRAEWERFTDISGGDVDLVSGSVFYRF